MLRIVISILAFILIFPQTIFPATPTPGDEPKTVAEAIEQSARLSQVTLPGSAPFHLKATAAEIDSPDSDYKAEIEEYWLAPDKWRRTIKTPDFSQTLIVNGDQVSEQNGGDGYYPLWLENIVTAIFDLAPDRVKGIAAQVAFPSPSPSPSNDPRLATSQAHSQRCIRAVHKVGISPVSNSIFTVLCFTGSPLLLKSVVSPGYHAEFDKFSPFKDKQVARLLNFYLEPGTKVEARVTTLEELSHPEEALFAIPRATPQKDRLRTLRVEEGAARAALLNSPEIIWAPVRDGKLKGSLSIVVAIDREGEVRETWPLNSDNPFPQDQARKEVMRWRFRPFLLNGGPVQAFTILTFGYETKIGDPVPVLSDAEARKLAITTAEPEFPSGSRPANGTTFTVRVAVNEKGEVIGVRNPNRLDGKLLGAANFALHQWRFRPYLRDGKPGRFDADIVFSVK